jgi:hypothetical protein
MVYSEVVHVVGTYIMLTLLYFSCLWHGGRTIFRDVFTGIGAEAEQVELVYSKSFDRTTKNRCSIKNS